VFDRTDLQARGFRGSLSFHELRRGGLDLVPDIPGTYVVICGDSDPPAFLDSSVGGHFKAKDPAVPVSTLEAKWIPGCSTLYIGKANRLRRRLKQFADFRVGRPVGHWGGRYIWQLSDSGKLLVAWLACQSDQTAREAESGLMSEFTESFAAGCRSQTLSASRLRTR
jgi:hypothetical protein